jgi:hypothetical protein
VRLRILASTASSLAIRCEQPAWLAALARLERPRESLIRAGVRVAQNGLEPEP